MEPKKRMVSLRISEKTQQEVLEKHGQDSLEYKFLLTLKEANVPYSVLSNMLGQPQSHIRDMITARKKYDDQLRESICVKMKKVIDRALDEGLLPCSDVAVVEPILRLTLRVMALGNK